MLTTLRADVSDGPALAIHGGAGARPSLLVDDEKAEYHAALAKAVRAGKVVLDAGGPALDAVCAAVLVLEDSPLFNAAHGAALNADGYAELDAAVMVGAGDAGGVAGVRAVRNPVLAARAVMEQTSHVLLVDPSLSMVEAWGLDLVPPEYFITPARVAQLEKLRAKELTGPRHGTVGAVARDASGALAAATSTGGTANQLPGRVGDSPIIGAGTWAANDTVAISCTGVGEEFMRQALAHSVHAHLKHTDATLGDAVHAAMADLGDADGRGGLIAVDARGGIHLTYNTEGMFSGWLDRGEIHTHV
ncbi:isoaspartyl peptidase/L-asparaginase family protein [Microbacterium sp. NPDC077663]|uniref:isoaspartyl peptidase/L-asparaginase family protein n=1 Tax=Microbacterium sp. NPDC077663 TaxID=3364189 RepID=UPI0037CC7656